MPFLSCLMFSFPEPSSLPQRTAPSVLIVFNQPLKSNEFAYSQQDPLLPDIFLTSGFLRHEHTITSKPILRSR